MVSSAWRSKTDSGTSSNSSSKSVRSCVSQNLASSAIESVWGIFEVFIGFPMVEAPLFLPLHGKCRDWEAFAVWKLDDDTEEIPASRCLAKDIIHRIAPHRLGTLHQRPAKANVFDLFRAYPGVGQCMQPGLLAR